MEIHKSALRNIMPMGKNSWGKVWIFFCKQHFFSSSLKAVQFHLQRKEDNFFKSFNLFEME